jgi:hypothetical protein
MSIPKEPEEVMKLRGGSVLGKKTILKSDHFPGCQNKRLRPNIDGAPNYRQVFFSLFIFTSQILSLSFLFIFTIIEFCCLINLFIYL